jgi:hypothetical protein
MKDDKQILVDICFDLVMTIHTYPDRFAKLSKEEIADWTAKQLRGCGFDTKPIGSSWGVLKRK